MIVVNSFLLKKKWLKLADTLQDGNVLKECGSIAVPWIAAAKHQLVTES
jgi:hypothetical protein